MNIQRLLDLLKDESNEYALKEIVSISTGTVITKIDIDHNPGEYPVINSGIQPLGFYCKWNVENDPISISSRGVNSGYISWTEGKFFRGSLSYSIKVLDENNIIPRYLYYVLKGSQLKISRLCRDSGVIRALNKKELQELLVKIPSLETQKAIVKVLESLESSALDYKEEGVLRKKQLDFYTRYLFSFDKELYTSIPLGDSKYINIENNKRVPVAERLRIAGDIPYYGANNIQDYVEGYTHSGNYTLVAEDGVTDVENYSIQWASGKFWANNHVHIIRGSEFFNTRYLYFYFKQLNFLPYLKLNTRSKLTKTNLVKIEVPLLPLEAQKDIVHKLNLIEELYYKCADASTYYQKALSYTMDYFFQDLPPKETQVL